MKTFVHVIVVSACLMLCAFACDYTGDNHLKVSEVRDVSTQSTK